MYAKLCGWMRSTDFTLACYHVFLNKLHCNVMRLVGLVLGHFLTCGSQFANRHVEQDRSCDLGGLTYLCPLHPNGWWTVPESAGRSPPLYAFTKRFGTEADCWTAYVPGAFAQAGPGRPSQM